jgi:peptidoglycan/LPS O-acetylase OafA/YrhL
VDVIADFYSPASRAWELLAGGLLALHMERQLIRGTRTSDFKSNAYSLLGFILIVLSIIVIDKKFMFPGLWALFPVVGTVLIILASPDC